MSVSKVASTAKDIRQSKVDMGDKLFHLASLDADGELVIAGAGALVYGAISAAPLKRQNGGTTVDLDGMPKVKAGGNFEAGAQLVSDAQGRAVAAGAGAANVFGIAREDGAANRIVTFTFARGARAA